ncbi:TetR/AcrR family transcriptional regulator [soil metagenome]
MSGAGAPGTTEKRHAPKGDERRAALLASLDHHLQEGSLDSINIADISRRAGVTRSAFYFYFESKAMAVAALSEEMYDESLAAAAHLAGDGTPAVNIEATIRSLFGAWERHQHLFRAMLDARATTPAVREMWDADRASFVPPIAEIIEAERAAGRAPAGTDASALASVLLELNDRMLERLALGGDLSRDQLVETVVSIWLRSIYGTTDERHHP